MVFLHIFVLVVTISRKRKTRLVSGLSPLCESTTIQSQHFQCKTNKQTSCRTSPFNTPMATTCAVSASCWGCLPHHGKCHLPLLWQLPGALYKPIPLLFRNPTQHCCLQKGSAGAPSQPCVSRPLVPTMLIAFSTICCILHCSPLCVISTDDMSRLQLYFTIRSAVI